MVSALLNVGVERLALLLGISLFFGFAFEEFYADELPSRPGGVRTFPLLALAGGGLYLLDSRYALAFVAGLLVIGSWIYAYVRAQTKDDAEKVEGLFVVPACNLLAYTFGAIALTQPLWLCVGVAVAGVIEAGQAESRFQGSEQRIVVIGVGVDAAVVGVVRLRQHHDPVGGIVVIVLVPGEHDDVASLLPGGRGLDAENELLDGRIPLAHQ